MNAHLNKVCVNPSVAWCYRHISFKLCFGYRITSVLFLQGKLLHENAWTLHVLKFWTSLLSCKDIDNQKTFQNSVKTREMYGMCFNCYFSSTDSNWLKPNWRLPWKQLGVFSGSMWKVWHLSLSRLLNQLIVPFLLIPGLSVTKMLSESTSPFCIIFLNFCISYYL